MGAAVAEPFTFVAWNVGHFADGRKGTSTIATTNVPAKRAAYRALFRELDAKVVGLVEYSPLFDAAGNVLTANAILDDYPHRLEGPVRGYHVNSVFLKGFRASDFRVIARPDLSDHCLVACTLEPCETAAPPLARVTFRITYSDGRVERRPNVFVTRYDNGEEVVCDYAAARYEIYTNNNNVKKGNKK